ncbi:protein-L-isoaspartate(D-aspartate) O-methyltransferase [Candidatus Sulfidibacterium hydrothermale]|uniref:protein-L-isoaspartate(D-aspartate) O-methyltransferase n=1 Tax=Candidatus Sulfidibacterium hydrothermale TaxID=2875962 RepID=UPI001F0AA563|nr:protein-L-isoaspartate(D-aspartate) O-methyltransferase [Candidatus Sulfidibacterium hydrothermale]UBM61779.1 protein-L-isoaspartate(D-aspartate) O-methyltransferase [Candidatus Sulfidibacterium hydrothermale]
MEDSYRHKGMRRRLVNEIRKKGILDEKILEAVYAVPRHLFLDSGFLNYAYEDKPFPIGAGQTISQPYTVAFQTELLQVQEGDKVLEIGTGSGYQACVLAALGVEVYSVERQKKLYEKARDFLPKLGFHVHLFYGDGYLGLPQFAPFDAVLITAAAPEIPQTLFDQLKTGGRLVSPVGEGDVQTMIRFHKEKDGRIIEERFGKFRFVPLLKNTADD